MFEARDLDRYNAIRAKMIDKASPDPERRNARDVLKRMETKYPGITEAARDHREAAAATEAARPPGGGVPPPTGTVDRLFREAVGWAVGVLEDDPSVAAIGGASDPWLKELKLAFGLPDRRQTMAKDVDKDKDAAGKEAAGKGRTRDLSKDLYRRMCKEALGGHLLGVDEETNEEVFVLHVEMPQDLWEALHDDPATLIEWINDNEAEDDEDDDDSDESEEE